MTRARRRVRYGRLPQRSRVLRAVLVALVLAGALAVAPCCNPRYCDTMAKPPKPEPTAAEVRALDHLSIEAAAAKLSVRPSYVRRIRERRQTAGRPKTSSTLRLDLPIDLHDQVREYAASLIAAQKTPRKRVA